MDAKARVGKLNPGDLLAPVDAAVLLGVSPSTVYRAIQRNELSAFKLGSTGTLRIPGVAVEQYLVPRAIAEAEKATASAAGAEYEEREVDA